MKKIFSLLLVLLLSVSLISCGGSNGEEEKTKIGYLSITHALPLYILDEVEKGDVELVKFGSWPDLMEALNSGKIDGASVLIELAMKAKSQGVDLKAVALGHKDGNVVVVNNNIKSAKYLIGETIAVPSKLSTHYVLVSEMLKAENIDISQVNIIELSPPEMPVALQEERIAAYCVAEPFGAKSVVGEIGKVYKQSSEIIDDSVCCGLVLREEYIKNKEEYAEDLVNKYVKAANYIEENGATEEAKKFLSVDEETIELSLQWISFDKLKIEKEDYEKLVQEVTDLGILDNPPTYEDFVDNSLIDKVNKDE